MKLASSAVTPMSLMRQHGLKERLLILALVFTVSACGFQLRGSLEISDDLSPLHLEKNSVFDLAREIKALLSANDIKTVESEAAGAGAEKANSQLSLLNESKTRRVLSVDGNGQAREYLLSYTVNYSIKIKQSKLLDESLKHQDEVTETLGTQVSRAVEVLIQSLDRINNDHNGKLLEGVEPTEAVKIVGNVYGLSAGGGACSFSGGNAAYNAVVTAALNALPEGADSAPLNALYAHCPPTPGAVGGGGPTVSPS